jgi:hypothetical protein
LSQTKSDLEAENGPRGGKRGGKRARFVCCTDLFDDLGRLRQTTQTYQDPSTDVPFMTTLGYAVSTLSTRTMTCPETGRVVAEPSEGRGRMIEMDGDGVSSNGVVTTNGFDVNDRMTSIRHALAGVRDELPISVFTLMDERLRRVYPGSVPPWHPRSYPGRQTSVDPYIGKQIAVSEQSKRLLFERAFVDPDDGSEHHGCK